MGELTKIKTLFVKNAKQMWRDKVRILSLLLFPLIMIGLFGSAVGSETTGLPTGVVYTEDSEITQQVLQGFHAAKTFQVKTRVGSIQAGKELISEGKIDTLIIIPSDTQERVNSGKSVTIKVMVDEANPQISQTALVASREVIQKVSTQLSASLIQGLQQNLAKISQYLHNLETSTQKVTGAIQTQRETLNQAVRTLNQGSSSLEDISSSLKKVEDNLGKLSQDGNFSVQTSPGNLSSLKQSVYHTELLTRNIEGIPPEKKKMIMQNLTVLEQGINQVENTLQNYSSMVSNLTQTVEKIKTGTQSTQEAIGKIQSGTKNVNRGLKRTENTLQQVEGLSEQISENVKKIGEEIGETGDNLQEATKDDPEFLSNPLQYARKVVYGKGLEYIDFLAPGIIAFTIFTGAVMGLGTAIAGERETGSLTRLFLTPTSSMTIVLGTGLFYTCFEFLRALLLLLASIWLFDLTVMGSFSLVLLVMGITAAGSVGLGLFFSSILKSEEQFRALSMVVVMPMMFISGVFFPVQNMPGWLQTLSQGMPLRYAAEALRGIMVKDLSLRMISGELTFLAIFALITLSLGGLLFKREVMS